MQKLRLFGMNGFVALILACTAGIARGQQAGYLILIDAENKQPFTARIGETLMQSTAHGHLLISQLKDSIYRIAIRFPHNPDPDQVFPVTVRKKDQGLQLKESADSWVLYNWQSRETIRPLREVDSSRLLERGVKREDGFSSLMAAVVNDTSVMYNTFTWNNLPESSLKGLVRADSAGARAGNKIVAAGFRRDSAGIAKKNRRNGTAQETNRAGIVANDSKTSLPDSVKSEEAVKTATRESRVRKLREVSLQVSRKMVFQDISPQGEKDTITLFVYFEKPEPVAKRPKEDPMVTARRLLRDDTFRKKQNIPEKEIHPAAKEDLVKNTGNDSLEKEQQPPRADMTASPKRIAGCSAQATDTDVATLRSAILVRNTEDEKISVSSETFGIKCFSVGQLRQLADLFVSDKARFRFLTAACGHVSDGDHFQELADLFPDKVYLKKFRTLAHKPG